MRGYIDAERSVLVPADQTREELRELENFLTRLDRRYGFKWESGLFVPAETPSGNMELLLSLRRPSPGWARVRQILGGFGPDADPYSPGLLLAVLQDPPAIIIHFVLPDSPARQAGLVPGDELLEADGRPVSRLSPEDLTGLLFKPDLPRQIRLRARRGDATVEVQEETRKFHSFRSAWESYQPLPMRTSDYAKDDYILGAEVLRADDPREAIIAHLDYPSPAFDAGLHVGDLLLAINGKPIGQLSREQLAALLSPTGPAETALTVSRLGKELKIRFTPATFGQAQATIGRVVTKLGPGPPRCVQSQ